MPATLVSDLDGDIIELALIDYDDDRPVAYATKAVEQSPGEFTPGGTLRSITTHREPGSISISLTLQIRHYQIDEVTRWLRARGNNTVTCIIPRRASYEGMMLGSLSQIGTVADMVSARLELRELRIVRSESVLFTQPASDDPRADAKADASEADDEIIDVGRTPLRPDQVTQGESVEYNVSPLGFVGL